MSMSIILSLVSAGVKVGMGLYEYYESQKSENNMTFEEYLTEYLNSIPESFTPRYNYKLYSKYKKYKGFGLDLSLNDLEILKK